MNIEQQRETLKRYGADITADGQIITPSNKLSGVYIRFKKTRLRMITQTDDLLMSGPIEPRTIEQFVEKFWYWKKR